MACLHHQPHRLHQHHQPHTRNSRRLHSAAHGTVQHRSSARLVPCADGGSALSIVYSQPQADVQDKVAFPCTVPLLPFTVEEVLLPGSVKTLHLFEARYLSLLDSVLAQPGSNKVFAHVVVEQQGDAFGDTAAAFPGAYRGDGFVFRMATLVRVVEIKRSFVGALVRIQTEARAEVTDVVQLVPYFMGRVVPLCDRQLQDEQLVSSQVEQLSQTVRDLQNLTQRFKSKQSASLQQAVYWADRAVLIPAVTPAAATVESLPTSLQEVAATTPASTSIHSSSSSSTVGGDHITTATAAAGEAGGSSSSASSSSEAEACSPSSALPGQQHDDVQGLAERAARLSFAALQGVPQESAKLKLLRCCVKAMKTTDTSARLTAVQDHMQNSLNMLAAKCALKSLNLS